MELRNASSPVEFGVGEHFFLLNLKSSLAIKLDPPSRVLSSVYLIPLRGSAALPPVGCRKNADIRVVYLSPLFEGRLLPHCCCFRAERAADPVMYSPASSSARLQHCICRGWCGVKSRADPERRPLPFLAFGKAAW